MATFPRLNVRNVAAVSLGVALGVTSALPVIASRRDQTRVKAVEACSDETGLNVCVTNYSLRGSWVSDEEVQAVYRVSENNIQGKWTPKVDAFAQRTWKRFAMLIPAEQRKEITSFEVHRPGYAAAYMLRNRETADSWTLGAAIDIPPADTDHALVHEFGHLLTIGNHFVPTPVGVKCATLKFTDATCATSDSFAAKYAAKFWSEDQLAAIKCSTDAAYVKAPGDFVDAYSATDPFEDLAETLATFVLGPQPKGAGAKAKIAMFANDPTMARIKEQILSARKS